MKKLCYWQFVQSRRISINRIDLWTSLLGRSQVSGSCLFWAIVVIFICIHIYWAGLVIQIAGPNCQVNVVDVWARPIVDEVLRNETIISLLYVSVIFFLF